MLSPEGTAVSIEKLTSGALFTLVQTPMDGVAGKFTAFDITATNGNVTVQPNGTVAVTFDIPDGYNMVWLAVYRVAPDGSKQKIESMVDKDAKIITFLLDSLSVYVLAELLPETSPQTSDIPIYSAYCAYYRIGGGNCLLVTSSETKKIC